MWQQRVHVSVGESECVCECWWYLVGICLKQKGRKVRDDGRCYVCDKSPGRSVSAHSSIRLKFCRLCLCLGREGGRAAELAGRQDRRTTEFERHSTFTSHGKVLKVSFIPRPLIEEYRNAINTSHGFHILILGGEGLEGMCVSRAGAAHFGLLLR